MPDEEIDKLVRDAANQHHPPYDDKSWGKMEALLDKHLPQKKDRKRPIVFLLLFLLLGGAVYFAVDQSQKNTTAANVAINTGDKPSSTTTPAAAANSTSGNSPANVTGANTTTAGQSSLPQGNLVAAGQGIGTGQQNTSPLTNTAEQFAKSNNTSYLQQGRTKIKVKKPGATEDNNEPQQQKNETGKNDVADNTAILNEASKNNEVNTVPDKVNDHPETAVAKTDSVKKSVPEKENTAATKNNTASAPKKNTPKKFGDKFAVTLSAGADVSFIEIKNAGKLKPAYGGGVSYSLGKHITVATGLYVSKKVYTASPYQYKFTGYVNPGLTDIGADCKIYEIPVSVYYTIKQAKNHSWLGGISLSSLLMKRETYDYNYQTASGQPYSYEKTVTNQNKHYFSVLTLSGGYQYKLNNRFSLIAEPYVKVPLTGIGLGKVKLNSTGILVTAAIKPFAKKKQ